MLDLTRYKHVVYDPSRSLERFLIKHIGRKKGRYTQGYDAYEINKDTAYLAGDHMLPPNAKRLDTSVAYKIYDKAMAEHEKERGKAYANGNTDDEHIKVLENINKFVSKEVAKAAEKVYKPKPVKAPKMKQPKVNNAMLTKMARKGRC